MLKCALQIVGALFDTLIALLLMIVAGWVMDSWHDRDPWAGPVVTTFWAIAFVLSAGAPIVGYRMARRGARPGRVALAVWLPALCLVAICAVGFIIFPP
jgi:hypothetical protein